MYYYLGLIILFLLVWQLGLGIAAHYRRVRSSARFRALERELLSKKIEHIIGQSNAPKSGTAAWAGWRKFRVGSIVTENDTIKSFLLYPHDGKKLSGFKPGQHLTFRLKIPGKSKPVIRCYSLSEGTFNNDYYRVTIREHLSPPNTKNIPDGISSGYFHNILSEQDILDVKAPTGKFYLDTTEKTPVAFIAGGVGLTPSLSMLNTLYALGSKRDIWLLYAVRSESDLIMVEHFMQISREMPNLQIHFFLSQIEDQKLPKRRHKGYISVEKMRELGVPIDADYYICGPAPMMKSIVGGLLDNDVDDERIHFESFGPASVAKSVSKDNVTNYEQGQDKQFSVSFNISNKNVVWDKSSGTLLETSEEAGVEMESGCRAGSCGTCITAVLKGEISYIEDPGIEVEKGCCLPCIAVPKSDILLNA